MMTERTIQEDVIEATTDADVVNGILNDPSIREWVDSTVPNDKRLDLSEQLRFPNVLALRGMHGLFLCYKYDIGIYEVHTAILPTGRGAWSRGFAKTGAAWMMTRTDCVEIVTRVPATHEAARRLTIDAGFRLQFATLPETKFRGELVPVEVYSLSLQDWARDAADMEREGARFHDWLGVKVGRGHGDPHPEDPAHNRVVGVTLAMLRGGQIGKAIAWYNRWALLARHQRISLVGVNPTAIRFDAGILTMDENGQVSYSPAH